MAEPQGTTRPVEHRTGTHDRADGVCGRVDALGWGGVTVRLVEVGRDEEASNLAGKTEESIGRDLQRITSVVPLLTPRPPPHTTSPAATRPLSARGDRSHLDPEP